MLAVAAGLRRGEIVGLKWADLDVDRAILKIRRAIEETKTGGIAFKEPKSKAGRRDVALPGVALDALKTHCARQKEHRDMLGVGYQGNDLICCCEDGSVWRPSAFTSSYRSLLKRRRLTGRTSFTMDQYAHLLPGQDEEAAKRTDAGLRKAIEATAHVAG